RFHFRYELIAILACPPLLYGFNLIRVSTFHPQINLNSRTTLSSLILPFFNACFLSPFYHISPSFYSSYKAITHSGEIQEKEKWLRLHGDLEPSDLHLGGVYQSW
ncbi:hypothetical protein CFOL_v3_11141, partial [Cephalotus follicularis]